MTNNSFSQAPSASSSVSSFFETPSSSIFTGIRRIPSLEDQLGAVAPDALKVSQVEALPKLKIIIDGKVCNFILEAWLSKRLRRTWISEYGFFVTRIDAQHRDVGHYWICKLCDRKTDRLTLYADSGTTGPVRHLKTHGIRQKRSHAEVDANDDEEATRRPGAIETSFARMARVARDVTTLSKEEEVKEAIVGWVLDDYIPFRGGTSKKFRKVLSCFNSRLTEELLPLSKHTIRRWIDEAANDNLAVIHTELAHALSRIHISADLGTSENTRGILAVAAHFVSQTGTLVNLSIALREVAGDHGGENLKEVVFGIITEFGIATDLGFFAGDNADSNRVCVETLLPDLRDVGDNFVSDPSVRQTRCIGHVFNIIAKGFLSGKSGKLFESLETDEFTLEDLAKWRKRGPLGKLHFVVHWIRRSPQRREAFREVRSGRIADDEAHDLAHHLFGAPLMLIADNETRWNSYWMMVERALKLKDTLDVYLFQASRDSVVSERRFPAWAIVSEGDWEVLEEMLEILRPLKKATMDLQGKLKKSHQAILYTDFS